MHGRGHEQQRRTQPRYLDIEAFDVQSNRIIYSNNRMSPTKVQKLISYYLFHPTSNRTNIQTAKKIESQMSNPPPSSYINQVMPQPGLTPSLKSSHLSLNIATRKEKKRPFSWCERRSRRDRKELPDRNSSFCEKAESPCPISRSSEADQRPGAFAA